MKKIPTLFDRDWNGNRKVIAQLDPRLEGKEIDWSQAICTEKFNGTNVAFTIENNQVINYWKRKNPSKEEKKLNIEPSYIEVDFEDPNTKYITKAITEYMWKDFHKMYPIPNGLYSAELIGPKIQGNPYNLNFYYFIFFSIPDFIKNYTFDMQSPNYLLLRNTLPLLKSHLNPNVSIEGLVWHFPDKSMIKIKTEDFDYRK